MISRIPFPRKYLTTRGVVDAFDINPGDYVYEWRTWKPLEVKAVEMIPYRNMYEVTYSDRRIEFHTNLEPVYLEDYTAPPHDPFCRCRRSWQFPITLFPIDFGTSKIREPLTPDPYIAGVLLIHGDQSDPYINYPKKRLEANNEFSHKYNIDYYPKTKDGKAYFQWKGKVADKPITWEEFFPKYTFYAKGHEERIIIPDEYMKASMNDRTQFIRGVFDMGYIQQRSPDTVALFLDNPCKIRWVQSMLWSMGISSTLTVEEKQKPEWKLEIQGRFDHYPGFFYDRNYIENMIRADTRESRRNLPRYNANKVTIVRTRPLEYCPYALHNPLPHIVLEKKHMFYTSTSYLPRVSI